jgi:hypothetical protein
MDPRRGAPGARVEGVDGAGGARHARRHARGPRDDRMGGCGSDDGGRTRFGARGRSGTTPRTRGWGRRRGRVHDPRRRRDLDAVSTRSRISPSARLRRIPPIRASCTSAREKRPEAATPTTATAVQDNRWRCDLENVGLGDVRRIGRIAIDPLSSQPRVGGGGRCSTATPIAVSIGRSMEERLAAGSVRRR